MARQERCLFCFEERELTREHLVSRPISDAFGLDRRAATIGEFALPPSAAPDIESLRFVSLDSMTVRAVCGPCNNGWMSRLEGQAADTFHAWVDKREVPRGGAIVVRRWLAARLLVWTIRDGGMRRLGEELEKGASVCIPNFDRAKRLARDDARALQGLQCGVARSSGGFMYGFGNAATHPPGQALPFTAVLALRLAPLDLWVADSLLDAKRIALPPGVVPITDHRRLASRVVNGQLAPDLVSVRFDPSVLAAERESLDAAHDRLSS